MTMANYEDIYKTVCRVCLSRNNTENMVCLTENSSDDGLSPFGKSITILTSVSLRKDDKLPKMMCQKCVFLLKQAIIFKLRCELSDRKLNKLVRCNVNKDLSDENIKEIVCEFVMYDNCFQLKNDLEPSKSTTTHENEDSDNGNIFNNFNDNTSQLTHETEFLDTLQDLINTDRNQTQEQMNNERNLLCKICNRVLANRRTYDHHMQRHNVECRFICDQCGKAFPVLAEMHMHQIARHGIGPYLQCDHCSYKAPRKVTLIEHLRIHTGERPFTCDQCGLTFRRKAIWRNHLVCHSEKKYQCTYCPRMFFRQGQMLEHCNNVHERKYLYSCHVCNITYAKRETVRRHMVAKHGIPREKQGKIVRIFNGSSIIPEK